LHLNVSSRVSKLGRALCLRMPSLSSPKQWRSLVSRIQRFRYLTARENYREAFTRALRLADSCETMAILARYVSAFSDAQCLRGTARGQYASLSTGRDHCMIVICGMPPAFSMLSRYSERALRQHSGNLLCLQDCQLWHASRTLNAFNVQPEGVTQAIWELVVIAELSIPACFSHSRCL
jgi:hypothetical protein